ncbi:unnamed protein product [Closterium sp. Yama58-4]|nr:unnamed protein product [Closterium sp. Yama58-4]
MLFNQFCQKVLKLAVVRVRSLCERLRLTAAVSEMVFRVVEHAVEGEVQLLFCRHLDQIILSSVYGVCKVSQVAVTFKDIIAQYRKLPHCKPSVFRNVFIDAKPLPADSPSKERFLCSAADSSCALPLLPPTLSSFPPSLSPLLPHQPIPQHGDIILFSNEIFVPTTPSTPCTLLCAHTHPLPTPHQPIPQHGDIIRLYNEIFSFLLHLGHGASTAGGAGGGAGGAGERGGGHVGSMFRSPLVHSSPALAHFQQHQQSPSSVPGASPRRVSSRHNVYVSPLPTSRMEALLASPHRQLSAQLSTQLLGGGLSADPFASPSRQMAAINHRINSTK